MGIYNWVIENRIPQPIKLEIELVKVVYDKQGRGNDSRYMRVYIQGHNVTQMIAEATGLKISKAKNYNLQGCLIIHGSGMDMGFALQDRMHSRASSAGYPNMFDYGNYICL